MRRDQFPKTGVNVVGARANDAQLVGADVNVREALLAQFGGRRLATFAHSGL